MVIMEEYSDATPHTAPHCNTLPLTATYCNSLHDVIMEEYSDAASRTNHPRAEKGAGR